MPKSTKSSDVFSSLNDFLSKDDDSFSFSENETPLSQADVEVESDDDLEIVKEVMKEDVPFEVPESSRTVDLSKIDLNFIPTAKKKTTRKRPVRNTRNLSINDDLTNVDVVPPKKSRLKKSEFFSISTPDDDIMKDEDNVVPLTRSGKPRKSIPKGRKPKAKPIKKATNSETGHLSLEEAMALVVEPIIDFEMPLIETPAPILPKRARKTRATFKLTVEHVSLDVDLTCEATPPHCTTPDVDLTGGATPPHSTSPMFQPRKKNVDSNDDSFGIDSVNIKLKLNGQIEIHTIRQHQKFLDIFKAVADKHNISTTDVLIYNDSKRIHYDDTPHSIAYRASIFLTCRIMEQSGTVDSIETFQRCRNENEIEIKVQSDKWSRPLKIKISKVEKFKIALDIIAESVEFKVEQMRLIFDGEIIDIDETPLDLEFEGGEIVDCKIID